ncbi:anti-sigma-K factor RskA [Haloactinopolyspora alba]|uniref:Regulator of SigK n=1 Tax=Haloactinopolyspora alba TaxID=648780 RepID=A0A2P8DZ63_9ACTN|nr:anti-sigma factor [Haloactinopolyspora alba]PSL02467.1 anti-sigma-K factor RskA [Haloactinopolyspora alba]
MTMPTNADIHTLAAPYALHSLPPDEATTFEAHLGECAACRAEVDEIRETAARLGVSAAVQPPPELKEQVLARIREVRPLPPAGDRSDADAETGSARARALRRWWPRVATGLVAAMAAGIAVLGVRLDDVQEELDRSQQIGAQMRQLADAPDLEMVRAEADGSRGTVLLSRSLDTAVLIADGMEPAPDEHVYQLWFIGDDGIRSAGVLGETDDGQVGPFTAQGVGGAGQLGITVEPAGGSEQPTTDPVMVIDLPA